jgi:phosphohistidine swiveling domain-containing protein
MKKIEQLQWFRRNGIPTPRFLSCTWEEFQSGKVSVASLRPPFAVRSTYSGEDGATASYAGHFHSALHVQAEDISPALQDVFDSYPTPQQEEVIIQEMVENPRMGGVLFAFREREWKVEWSRQGPTAVVGGSDQSTLFLPPFNRLDYTVSSVLPFWSPDPSLSKFETRQLIRLAAYTRQLLDSSPEVKGLDIEFVIDANGLWLLQARPISTPEEGEWVLTSANHKEILPPIPSRMMTGLMEGTGNELFGYYRNLDSTLPVYPFLVKSGGMPWINLTALLRVMVAWGLPSNLVCRSVGAVDYLKVGLRPHQMIRKVPVFLKVARQQLTAAKRVSNWLQAESDRQNQARTGRERLWEEDPIRAFQQWCSDFRGLYVRLVSNMQMLTGAMSGPVRVLEKLGLMPEGGLPSASTDFFDAFQLLQQGKLDRPSFLQRFGHRGFYESDLGQPRFREFSEKDWAVLLGPEALPPTKRNGNTSRLRWPVSMAWNLVQLRERVRHETMKHFEAYRQELQERSQQWDIPENRIWSSPPKVWEALLQCRLSDETFPPIEQSTPTGWDHDAFLANGYGRRLPLTGNPDHQASVCIFPGKVKGRAWRVKAAGIETLESFPKTEDPVILIADALDPGWIPYFSRIAGVVSRVGGVLSHASIILREAGIPSLTQYSVPDELKDGAWIELDALEGSVRILSDHQPR